MKRLFIYMIMAVALNAGVTATTFSPDEEDYDESIRKRGASVRSAHFGEEMKKMRDKKAAKQAKEEEKEARKREKENKKKNKGKNDDRRVVEVRQMPEQTQEQSADKAYLQELLSKDYTIPDYGYAEPEPIVWHDDPVSNDVDTLMAQVKTAKQGGGMLYTPKGVTMQRGVNEVFFAFEGNSHSATGPLELRVYYFADDPLNYNEIRFIIDGFPYSLTPANPSRGKMGARMYWEQSQDALTADDKDLVYALAHCHWARMILRGADGINHVKDLTEDHFKAFNATLELYRAMGGQF